MDYDALPAAGRAIAAEISAGAAVERAVDLEGSRYYVDVFPTQENQGVVLHNAHRLEHQVVSSRSDHRAVRVRHKVVEGPYNSRVWRFICHNTGHSQR